MGYLSELIEQRKKEMPENLPGNQNFLKKITYWSVDTTGSPERRVLYLQIETGGRVPITPAANIALLDFRRLSSRYNCYRQLAEKQKIKILEQIRKDPFGYSDY